MKDKKEIEKEREEMKNEFPLLFGVERKNPFSVPDTYFDEAAVIISLKINVNDQSGESNVSDFSVPDNYFQDLENRIKNKIKFEDLKEQSFETPAAYFEKLESDIKRNILLDNLKKQAFSTPGNYFENSAEQIRTELFLQDLRRDAVFSVPENYFEEFENRFREKLELSKPEAKVISMVSYVKKFRYVAAAAVLIGVTIMAWVLLNNQQHVSVQLSQADKTKIIENPELFGIDESTIADMAAENPDIISAIEDVPDNVSDEALNEIDESLITGE